MSFLAELKRRNVIRVLIAYLAHRLAEYYAHIGDKDMTLVWVRKVMESGRGFFVSYVWNPDFGD